MKECFNIPTGEIAVALIMEQGHISMEEPGDHSINHENLWEREKERTVFTAWGNTVLGTTKNIDESKEIIEFTVDCYDRYIVEVISTTVKARFKSTISMMQEARHIAIAYPFATHGDIAEIAGCAPSTVSNSLDNGINEWRKYMKRQTPVSAIPMERFE